MLLTIDQPIYHAEWLATLYTTQWVGRSCHFGPSAQSKTCHPQYYCQVINCLVLLLTYAGFTKTVGMRDILLTANQTL